MEEHDRGRIVELSEKLRQPPDSDATTPSTPEQWQEAVDAAYVLLMIDSARQYGLVTGGPAVVRERCGDILELGKLLGHEPDRDAVDEMLLAS